MCVSVRRVTWLWTEWVTNWLWIPGRGKESIFCRASGLVVEHIATGVFVLIHYCKCLMQTDSQHGGHRLAWSTVVCFKVYQAGELNGLATARTVLVHCNILSMSFVKTEIAAYLWVLREDIVVCGLCVGVGVWCVWVWCVCVCVCVSAVRLCVCVSAASVRRHTQPVISNTLITLYCCVFLWTSVMISPCCLSRK